MTAEHALRRDLLQELLTTYGPCGQEDAVRDKTVADRLLDIATALDLSPQPAVLGAFESDASHAKAGGVAARAGLLCLPTLSTHGYEVIAQRAIPDMSAVLVEFLAG